MRSADLPPSYRAWRLVVLSLTGAAVIGLAAWSVWYGLPQEVQRWVAAVSETCWTVWTMLG
ncbi:hypothetical protein [Micromonospora sp. MA102]|uniref:hypothetical protein n=1 Tax=Micromonospora sp. MA102 TaxID=2952755 RepID=UPI0021C6F49F|nr:hypothetical protein [Micromonospora sp. MA102]